MKYVLAISLGPVGSFVAAGRRSRDLWYGSTWLSETTRHVAEALGREEGIQLLLPTEARLEKLREELPDDAGGRGLRISNKVLAVVDAEDTDPRAGRARLRALASSSRRAAADFLVGEMDHLRSFPEWSGVIDASALDLQKEAILAGDFIELRAGWTPLVDGDPFGSSVSRACQIRDGLPKLFGHPSFSRSGVERSHLDEGRDSVLHPEAPTPNVTRRRPRRDAKLRISAAKAGLIENEQLDAIGFLRRAGPYLRCRSGAAPLPPLPFAPIARVAAEPWIAGAAGDTAVKSRLEDLRRCFEGAKERERSLFSTWCSPAREPGETRSRFPYDASALFDGAADALLRNVREIFGDAAEGASVKADLAEVGKKVRALHQQRGVPKPYYALVELDGDGIGSLLADQKIPERYAALVQALDAFADGANEEIQRHDGTAFYVAADELLAYLPVDRTLGLVRALSKRFGEELSRGGFDGRTLSAGVVIAHRMDDLRGVRAAARNALKLAKQKGKQKGGGYACLREQPRGGADRHLCDETEKLCTRVERFAGAVAERASSLRTEQILRDHLELFGERATPEAGPPPPGVLLAREAIRQQIERSGRRDHDPVLERLEALSSWSDVEALADELRIASRIADVAAQRGRR